MRSRKIWACSIRKKCYKKRILLQKINDLGPVRWYIDGIVGTFARNAVEPTVFHETRNFGGGNVKNETKNFQGQWSRYPT